METVKQGPRRCTDVGECRVSGCQEAFVVLEV